LKMRYNW